MSEFDYRFTWKISKNFISSSAGMNQPTYYIPNRFHWVEKFVNERNMYNYHIKAFCSFPQRQNYLLHDHMSRKIWEILTQWRMQYRSCWCDIARIHIFCASFWYTLTFSDEIAAIYTTYQDTWFTRFSGLIKKRINFARYR